MWQYFAVVFTRFFVFSDLLPDKERHNLARQLYTLRGKINRARRGMAMVHPTEMVKMEKVRGFPVTF